MPSESVRTRRINCPTLQSLRFSLASDQTGLSLGGLWSPIGGSIRTFRTRNHPRCRSAMDRTVLPRSALRTFQDWRSDGVRLACSVFGSDSAIGYVGHWRWWGRSLGWCGMTRRARPTLRELDSLQRRAYCGCTSLLVKEHVVPIAKGGRDHWSNVVPACKMCNDDKWTFPLDVWLKSKPESYQTTYSVGVAHRNAMLLGTK